MKTSIFFFFRLFLAWGVAYLLFLAAWNALFGSRGEFILILLLIVCIAIVIITGTSHLRRVRLLSDHVDATTLANRQRRMIEVPFEAGEAFDMLDAAIRELPDIDLVESARDSLQIRAKIWRQNPYGANAAEELEEPGASTAATKLKELREEMGMTRNQILATVTLGDGTSSIQLVCEPESRAFMDWFFVDDGTNLENANALVRAISRRVSVRRRAETASVAETATEKELAVAKLGLLHAQVEPHFLYNTLGSAKYLVKSDPDKAEAMLNNLITYLRNSLPRTDSGIATLGDELDRVRAYLEILQFRMGPRLAIHIEVADSLKPIAFPTMMLQTLVENAIKHGLEPKSGGGNIWVIARATENQLSVTVADDGLGINTLNKGTGIGLNNVRERLKLAHGAAASLNLVANFPSGVAATITMPIVGLTATPSVTTSNTEGAA